MVMHARRPKEDQNLWNFLFSVLFAILLGLSVMQIHATWGGYPTSVPLFDALLMALAVFRVTRLVVYDKITRFAREWFVQQRDITHPEGGEMVELAPFPRGMRRTVHDLLQCPWCVGVWASLLVVFSYFEFAWAWYVIFMLAVAGAGSFLQVTSNLIGWKAELGKLEALELEKEAKL